MWRVHGNFVSFTIILSSLAEKLFQKDYLVGISSLLHGTSSFTSLRKRGRSERKRSLERRGMKGTSFFQFSLVLRSHCIYTRCRNKSLCFVSYIYVYKASTPTNPIAVYTERSTPLHSCLYVDEEKHCPLSLTAVISVSSYTA